MASEVAETPTAAHLEHDVGGEEERGLRAGGAQHRDDGCGRADELRGRTPGVVTHSQESQRCQKSKLRVLGENHEHMKAPQMHNL